MTSLPGCARLLANGEECGRKIDEDVMKLFHKSRCHSCFRRRPGNMTVRERDEWNYQQTTYDAKKAQKQSDVDAKAYEQYAVLKKEEKDLESESEDEVSIEFGIVGSDNITTIRQLAEAIVEAPECGLMITAFRAGIKLKDRQNRALEANVKHYFDNQQTVDLLMKEIKEVFKEKHVKITPTKKRRQSGQFSSPAQVSQQSSGGSEKHVEKKRKSVPTLESDEEDNIGDDDVNAYLNQQALNRTQGK